jgi:hypothetical protein
VADPVSTGFVPQPSSRVLDDPGYLLAEFLDIPLSQHITQSGAKPTFEHFELIEETVMSEGCSVAWGMNDMTEEAMWASCELLDDEAKLALSVLVLS